MPFKALVPLPKESPCIGKQHGSPRKVRFHYKNKHNNREKGEGTRGKIKEKIQKKQGREAQEKTITGILSANGTRSGDGTEPDIRRLLVKSHLVEAIVILPRNMLYSTDISVTLRISAGNQQNDKTVKQRNRKNIAELFGRNSKTILKHIANAIKEELAGEMVVANFATTTEHGAIKGKSQTNHARFAVLQALKRRPRKYLFQLYQLTFEAASFRVVISKMETTTPLCSPPS